MAYDPNVSIADAIKRYGLPKSHRVHWSDQLKADVVRAVHSRAITFHEARERYLLSRDEFEQWERDCAAKGLTSSRTFLLNPAVHPASARAKRKAASPTETAS
ncbi:MAG: DUF1153 domain-containing protein [Pseudomonadota bacterium]